MISHINIDDTTQTTPYLNKDITLEIVFTIASPALDILFIGCVLNKKIAYTTAGAHHLMGS